MTNKLATVQKKTHKTHTRKKTKSEKTGASSPKLITTLMSAHYDWELTVKAINRNRNRKNNL